MGFAPPIDAETGLPKILQFPATSINAVYNYFNQFAAKHKSKNLYTLIAVPLTEKATPFVLCSFGTTNRFDFNIVLNR